MGPVLSFDVRVDGPFDLNLTLGPLRHGRFDPTIRKIGTTVWRASRTPAGPVTLRLRPDPANAVVDVTAWGDGATWAAERTPGLIGAGDDSTTFVPRHPILIELWRRFSGLRIPRTEAVLEAMVPAIIEQKVTGLEARRSYAALSRALGVPAPGPAGLPRRAGGLGLLLPAPAATLAELPSWSFHPWGIERRRAGTIIGAARSAVHGWLEATVSLAADEGQRRLQTLTGVGPWTAAEVATVAFGDADAVSVGDYHLPHQVAWALAGEARGDDAHMLELLEPYRGHRARVLRLLAAGGITAPRFGPRATPRDIRDL